MGKVADLAGTIGVETRRTVGIETVAGTSNVMMEMKSKRKSNDNVEHDKGCEP